MDLTLKMAITAHKQKWIKLLSIVLLELWCIPNSLGISPFLSVTGKTSLCPRDLLAKVPTSKESSDLFLQEFDSKLGQLEFNCLILKLVSIMPYIPKDLYKCKYI